MVSKAAYDRAIKYLFARNHFRSFYQNSPKDSRPFNFVFCLRSPSRFVFASGGASSRVFFGSTKKKSPWKLIRSTSAIRRVIRGIYDYPKFSNLLGQQLSPDLDQVAAALARKFGWHIQVTGPSALNLLGLSTQVPGRIIYASDGPDCRISPKLTPLISSS